MKVDLDITHLYNNIDEWENDFNKLKNNIEVLKKSESNIFNSVRNFKDFVSLRLDSEDLTDKLFCYCKRQVDIDFSLTDLKEKMSEVLKVYSSLQVIGTNLENSIINKSDKVYEFLNDKELLPYKRFLSEILRRKEHILEKEEDIEYKSEYMSKLEKIKERYQSILLNECGSVSVTINEKEIEVNKDNINSLLKDENQDNRRLFNEAFVSTYKNHDKEITSLLKDKLELDIELSKRKKFNSLIEEKMFTYDLPLSIFTDLIKCINSNLDIKHDFNSLRKKILKLDNFYSYDTALSICDIPKIKISLDDGVNIIKNALSILGNDYISLIDKMFNEGWIDVYPKERKVNRIYTSIAYQGVPYIITNYRDDILSVKDLSHEIGHSINTHYSKLRNHSFDFSVSFFLTEVASKVNEILVYDYMLKNASSNSEKQYILYSNINVLINAIFNQTMLSEFEDNVVKKITNKEEVNSEYLNNLYLDLSKKYNGPSMEENPNDKYGWMRITHFIMQDSYYVYQYSVGASIALYIVNKLYNDEGMKQRYLEFLSLGDSASIVECLNTLGIDLSDDYNSYGLKYLKKKIKDFESIL